MKDEGSRIKDEGRRVQDEGCGSTFMSSFPELLLSSVFSSVNS